MHGVRTPVGMKARHFARRFSLQVSGYYVIVSNIREVGMSHYDVHRVFWLDIRIALFIMFHEFTSKVNNNTFDFDMLWVGGLIII